MSMGKILIFCRIQLKFCFLLYKKCWHISWKFQLEIRSHKKGIAKKPLTNLYEMNSKCSTIQLVLNSSKSKKQFQVYIIKSTVQHNRIHVLWKISVYMPFTCKKYQARISHFETSVNKLLKPLIMLSRIHSPCDHCNASSG